MCDMNNLPSEKLIQIIKDNGVSITNNPQQCKAFLLDYCGEYRLEINVLMSALQEGIVKELCNIIQGIPLESILAKLRQQLETNLGIREDIAQWAVESWAIALGIIKEVELIVRPSLHIIWICDCSESMNQDGKIQALNNMIRQTILLLQDIADESPFAQFLISAVKFSSKTQWHIRATPIKNFDWKDLESEIDFMPSWEDAIFFRIKKEEEKEKAMGQALSIVTEKLKTLEERSFPPFLILTTDGFHHLSSYLHLQKSL